MRAVLDTNVLISGLLFGGNPREVMRRALRGEVELCLSEAMLSELGEVLQRPKFGFAAGNVGILLAELTAIARLVDPTDRLHEIEADDADNRVLECALTAGAEYIVTGDDHLLALGEYRSIRIVTPQEFLTIEP